MMRRATWKSFLFCTASFVALPLLASAQSSYSFHPEPLQPRIEAGAKVGTERSMGTMEGWAPIAQDDDSVLYADIRWMADDEENQEGNLGLGYRSIVNDKLAGGDAIVGGHAWVDRRRTDRGSTFYQVTAGAEYLKEDWDVKANAYIPLNKEKEYLTANSGNANPYLSGTGIFVDTNGTLVEEAQPGGDIEVGYRIPAFEQNIDAIRVYGGGYAFIGDRSDDTVGGRIRTSVDINPLINVGARFQYDEPRGSQGFLEATLRFPFKAKKRFQTNGLRARLDESPERDIDIVTGSTVTDSGLRKEVINTTSGTTQRVIHVDNTASSGGNGSVDNPFNTLAAAQAAMLDNDVIYVHRGTGTSTGMDQGITINKNNVQLIGSGTDFVFDTDKFVTRRPGITPSDNTVIIAKSAAPVITNSIVGADITVGNGVLVTGDNTTVSGVAVSGASKYGIYAQASSTQWENLNISENLITNNTLGGLRVASFNGSTINEVDVQHNNISGNTGTNVGLLTNDGSYFTSINIVHNNASSSVTGGGIVVVSIGLNAVISNINIEDNNTTGNVNQGIYVLSNPGGRIETAKIKNNVTSGSSNATFGDGIQIQTNGTAASMGTIEIENNTATNNNFAGIYILSAPSNSVASAIDSVKLSGNITDNNSSGIMISANAMGSISSLLMENNMITNNRLNGLAISTIQSGALSASIYNNTFTANGTASAGTKYYGISINHDSTGTFNVDLGGGTLSSTGGNRIYNNFYRDVFVDSRPGTAAATPGTTISAQHNWWGIGTGLNQGTRADFDNGSASPGSSIDASNHLTTDPGI